MTARAPWLTPALLAAACLVAGLGLAIGSVSIPPAETVNRLAHALMGRSAGDTFDRILLEARLPRVVLGGAVGAALALAGLAAQTLFRNPLATPSVIGVSNGAALGAVLGMLLAGQMATVAIGFSTALSVLMGLAVATIVYLLGRRGAFFGHALLLAGIAIGAFCSSLTTAALYLAGERLQAIVFWLMGGLWQANWRSVTLMVPLAVTGLALMIAWSRDLNLALLGERTAYDLGLNLPRLQRRLLVLIATLTAIAVSLTGVIGFIGLIVPHLLRLLVGADHRRLVLPTALGGAILLVLADLLARTLASPAEIPVGIFTALVGAPVFLWLLQRRRPVGQP
jgi:iron complex transport system permease protein